MIVPATMFATEPIAVARLETVIFLVMEFVVSTIGRTSIDALTEVPAYAVNPLILVSLMTRLLFSS